MEIDKIYNMDCLDLMKQMADNTIDLTVTSPPYDNLRTYNGNIDQWNFDKFKQIADELYRITKEGGIVVWVVGDATVKGSETSTSFKQALYFKEIGFNLHDTMIYAKKAPIPLNHNRYEQQFEYMFIFSKNKPKAFNPILEKCSSFGKTNHMTHRRTSDELSMASGYGKKCKEQRIKYNIWFYQKGKECSEHPAIFPLQLAKDHIISWSNENDLVFDPFMGSGTTAVASIELKRHYIGAEIDKQYYEICQNRINNEISQMTLFDIM